MLAQRYPYYLANRPRQPNADLAVTDKYSGEIVARVALADAVAVEEAIAAAVRATGPMRRLAPYARQEVLEHCVRRFRERAEELALALCIEAGKPIRDARGEVARLIETFKAAAEEAVRGDMAKCLNLEVSERTAGYRGFTQRVPVGPCSFITPFNFPLNLVAHKVAPAIAAGCPFVLKPSDRTPVSAMIMAEVLAETGLPEGAFSVLPTRLEDVGPFIEDDRLKLLSFTGSEKVGWELKARAGRKKVVLELGGNAACVVDRDQGEQPGLRGGPRGPWRLLPGGAELHLGAASAGARVAVRSAARAARRTGASAASGQPPGRGHHARAHDRRARRAAAGGLDSAGRARVGRACWRGEGGAARCSRPPCWRVCPLTSRCARRRRSGRWCCSSPSGRSRRRCAW